MKNKKGFTLIELLAVIIILGILMIIAIPSVTKYISDSRKSAYIDTAKEVIGSARNLVNSGELEMYDTNTTYYLDVNCISTENAMKSPYGDFVEAYVVVTYDGKGYDYYWTSIDDAGQGIKKIIRFDKLDIDNIESDLTSDDISTYRGIDGREYTIVISKANNCKKQGSELVRTQISGETGKEILPICRPATTLHTATCSRTDEYGCNGNGQVGNGNTITYGTLVSGTPKAGDAYDCDVNDDGVYDSDTERFYYLKSDENYTLFIYSQNLNNQSTYAYDLSHENWHGPVEIYKYLPSKNEWSHPYLIAPGTRQIVTNDGTTTTSGGELGSFSYTDKVARLITYQEIGFVCGSSGMTSTGYLNNCVWLMEGARQYEKATGSFGYWLENPKSSNPDCAMHVSITYRRVFHNYTENVRYYGVRPVITVKTSNIEN